MPDFKKITLNDCCEILDSKRIPLNSEQREKIPGEIPYYGANGVQGFINNYIFDEPLILLAEDGGNFEQYEARSIAYKIEGKSWVNNHAHILKSKNGFDHDYIFYSLEHKNILSFIVGGTRSKLNQEELKTISIDYPNQNDEPSIIAKILSTVDKSIEQTEKLIAKYEKIKTGLMQDLLNKGIDENGKIRSEETHEFKDSSLGRIPVEWEVMELGKCSKIYYGISLPLDRNLKTGIDIISLPNVNIEGHFVLDDLPKIDMKNVPNDKFLKYGDLLFNWRNGSIEHLGKTAFFDLKGKFTHVGFLLKIKTKRTKLLDRFAFHYLTFIRKQGFFRIAKIQVNNTFNKFELSQLKIKVPKETTEQKAIDTIIDKKLDLIASENNRLKKLIKIKTGLMQDLLTGKVRVSKLLKN